MSKRILLVEDDASVLEGVRRLLSAAGYEVETARNGLEALERVNRQKPDAIILDLNERQLVSGKTIAIALDQSPEDCKLYIVFLQRSVRKQQQRHR